MGKIVVTEFITLDGIVEDPGGAEPGSPPTGPPSTAAPRAIS